MDINRRDFFKLAGATAIAAAGGLTFAGVEGGSIVHAQAPVVGSKLVKKGAGSTAKVYFTKKIDAAHLIKLYDMISESIYGKVGIKLHTGEPHGPNILPRDMVAKLQAHIPNSNIIETNTMYAGARYTTAEHRETLKINGWTFCPVDIMDEDGGVDFPVNGGLHLKSVEMGKTLPTYDSILVLTHFKGHMMGGFGGSLKNIAIGMASGQMGKRQVHGYTKGTNMPPTGDDWAHNMPMQDEFMELMADSGKATCDHFGKRIVFINVMRRMSVDCDCAGTSAAEPTIPDIGICASTDILAIDQACVDMVYNSPSNHDLIERIESRHGLRQLSAMAELKMGNPNYELIAVD